MMQAKENSSHPLRIALAMADESVARVTQRYLAETEGIVCNDVYPRGKTLLREVYFCRYDCILVDELLQDMDAIEFMERLAAADRPVGSTIIFLLRSSHRAIHQKLLSYGPNYCMIKPYDLATLVRRIRMLCGAGAEQIQHCCLQLFQSWRLRGDEMPCVYLTEAVVLAEQNDERMAIKKELLREVSKLHIALSANAVECSLRRLVDRLEEQNAPEYLAFKMRAGLSERPSAGRLVYAVQWDVHRAIYERGEEECLNQTADLT
ncbi:MAG: response regulator [Faecalibacterium sp.]|nr:response regulator [Faecalibacterium sp.]